MVTSGKNSGGATPGFVDKDSTPGFAEDATPGFADEGSIYEYTARMILHRYAGFVEGTPNDTLVVLSSHPLSAEARAAIDASAKSLGYGADACAWVLVRKTAGPDAGVGSTTPEDGLLADEDVLHIVEGLDPIGVIATDVPSLSLLSKAYGKSLSVNEANRLNGRTVVALADFELMLKEEDAKQRAWHLLKSLKR